MRRVVLYDSGSRLFGGLYRLLRKQGFEVVCAAEAGALQEALQRPVLVLILGDLSPLSATRWPAKHPVVSFSARKVAGVDRHFDSQSEFPSLFFYLSDLQRSSPEESVTTSIVGMSQGEG